MDVLPVLCKLKYIMIYRQHALQRIVLGAIYRCIHTIVQTNKENKKINSVPEFLFFIFSSLLLVRVAICTSIFSNLYVSCSTNIKTT